LVTEIVLVRALCRAIPAGALVADYLGGRRLPGWEPQEEVAARFEAAVLDAMRATDRPVVVFTHGQALTLWLQRLGAITDAVGFWSRLAMPDAVPVEVQTRRGRLVLC
jgi:broad specificity phosphatase PhoE